MWDERLSKMSTTWLGLPVEEQYGGLNIKSLPLNFAYVVANTTVENISVYSNKGCSRCPYYLEKELVVGEDVSWQVDTSVSSTWRIMTTDGDEKYDRNGLLCEMKPTLHEFGVYRLDVGRCDITTEISPVNIYLPLLLFVLILMTSLIIYRIIKLFKLRADRAKLQSSQFTAPQKVRTSLETLLQFRGLILVVFIFITSGGGGYGIFYQKWGGLSIADYLLFIFSWTIGFSIPTMAKKMLFEKSSRWLITGDILLRSVVVIFLGILTDFTIDYEKSSLILWCPLQRLGLAYLFVGFAYLITARLFELKSKKISTVAFANIKSLLGCWTIFFFLLTLVVILTTIFMSFNCQEYLYLETIKTNIIIKNLTENCTNSVSELANSILVGEPEKMLYVDNYFGYSGGLTGTLSTISVTMTGLKAGIVYLYYKDSEKLKLWTILATFLGTLGIVCVGVSIFLHFNLWPVAAILLISTTSIYAFIIMYIFIGSGPSCWVLQRVGYSSLLIISGHLLFMNFLPLKSLLFCNCHFFHLLQSFIILCIWIVIGAFLKHWKINFSF